MKADVPKKSHLTFTQKDLLTSKLKQVAKTVDGIYVYDKGWDDDRVLKAMGGDPYRRTHVRYYRQELFGPLRVTPSGEERKGASFVPYNKLRKIAESTPGFGAFLKLKGVDYGSATKAQLKEFLASAPSPSPKPLPPEPQKPRDYDLLRVELDEAHRRIDAIEAFVKALDPNWKPAS